MSDLRDEDIIKDKNVEEQVESEGVLNKINTLYKKHVEKKIYEKFLTPFILALFSYMFYLFAYIFLYGFYFSNSKATIFRSIINPVPLETKSLICIGALLAVLIITMGYLFNDLTKLELLKDTKLILIKILYIVVIVFISSLGLVYVVNDVTISFFKGIINSGIIAAACGMYIILMLGMTKRKRAPLLAFIIILIIQLWLDVLAVSIPMQQLAQWLVFIFGAFTLLFMCISIDRVYTIMGIITLYYIFSLVLSSLFPEMTPVLIVFSSMGLLYFLVLIGILVKRLVKWVATVYEKKGKEMPNWLVKVKSFFNKKKSKETKTGTWPECLDKLRGALVGPGLIFAFCATMYLIYNMGRITSEYIPDNQYDTIYYINEHNENVSIDGQIIGRDKNVFYISTKEKELVIISAGSIVSDRQNKSDQEDK